MKSKTIVVTALVAILLSIIATAAVASSGSSTSTSSTFTQNGWGHGFHGHPLAACSSLTVGQTLTATGLVGRYVETSSSTTTKGTAAGTFTFVVSVKYAEGCTLSIKSGTFALGPTTYAVTGGSLVMGRGSSGTGLGTTSAGTFLISISGMHQSTTSFNIGAVALDFKTGTSEFLVNLHTPMSTTSGGSG